MKKAVLFFYTLFGIALFLKFFHIHYNAIGMLVGLAGILAFGVADLIKPRTQDNRFFHLTVGSWLLYLFIQVKFLPFGFPIVILSSLFTLFFIISIVRSKQFILIPSVLTTLFFALGIAGMSTDGRYYLFNVKGNYEIEKDYYTLDKYSWFLYQNEKYNEALQVSGKVYDIAFKQNDLEFLEIVSEHQIAIKKETGHITSIEIAPKTKLLRPKKINSKIPEIRNTFARFFEQETKIIKVLG